MAALDTCPNCLRDVPPRDRLAFPVRLVGGWLAPASRDEERTGNWRCRPCAVRVYAQDCWNSVGGLVWPEPAAEPAGGAA